jgi:hypothetical protein
VASGEKLSAAICCDVGEQLDVIVGCATPLIPDANEPRPTETIQSSFDAISQKNRAGGCSCHHSKLSFNRSLPLSENDAEP